MGGGPAAGAGAARAPGTTLPRLRLDRGPVRAAAATAAAAPARDRLLAWLGVFGSPAILLVCLVLGIDLPG